MSKKTGTAPKKGNAKGSITQVIGPVVDVEFGSDAKLPEINNALIVYKDVNGLKTKITLEVALELGDGAVRTTRPDV